MGVRAWLVFGVAGGMMAQVGVTQELLDRALRPVQVDTAPAARYTDAIRDYSMTIGMERCPGGRLWSAWVGGGDNDKGYFLLASSDDDGRTWTDPRVAIDPEDAPGVRQRTLVGNLWLDPLGRLWLFYDQSLGYFDGRAGDWVILCENREADAPVWSVWRTMAAPGWAGWCWTRAPASPTRMAPRRRTAPSPSSTTATATRMPRS